MRAFTLCGAGPVTPSSFESSADAGAHAQRAQRAQRATGSLAGMEASAMQVDVASAKDQPMEVDAEGAPKPAAAVAVPPKAGLELPWLEKYRPHVLKDVVGNTEAVARLQVIAEEGNMPNLILAGPPGTGKTTSILCLANHLLGPSYKDAVLELNASDDRGIDVVRNKIKMFAQKKVTLPPGRHKVIILDEADSMTGGAQQALRRTMEIYSATTRFALACNQSTKIIEPIQSRCAVVRYSKIGDVDILKRLLLVCEKEGVSYSDEGLEAIVFTADGDMRQSLNNLQATHSGFGHVSPDNVFRVCDQPHPKLVAEMVVSCVQGNIDAAYTRMKELCDMGYSATDIITTLFRVTKTAETHEFVKLEYLREIGFCHMRIAEGVNSRLQLSGLLCKMCKITQQ